MRVAHPQLYEGLWHPLNAMRLLLIHADHLEFTSTGPAGKDFEHLTPEMETNRYEEVLVAFTSVEAPDVSSKESEDQVLQQATQTIVETASTVKAQRILLYPYAHLSPNLAPPTKAMALLPKLEGSVAAQDWEVARSPFGHYKAFTLACKGHPLSELSREIHPGKEAPAKSAVTESAALEGEEKARSTFHLLLPDGTLAKIKGFKFGDNRILKTMVGYEVSKARESAKEPPHIALMQRLEMVDHEPGSDAGNLRWYPKGLLVKQLLERHIGNMCHRAGAMEVETPEIYDYQHPSLAKYIDRFPARQYQVLSGEKKYFLRFAACFGQFLIAHDMQISYRHLPLRMYELAKRSYRREKSGELAGLRRLRGFTMPDLHTFVADHQMALQEFEHQFNMSVEWMEGIQVPYEAAMRVQTQFFEDNRQFYERLAARLGRPMLLELFDERYAYFITKFEFNAVDTQGKAAALSTVQIDVENAETYDINYVDAEGEKQRPLIMHASISGSTDRNLYALLEHAADRMARGQKPSLPFWLSPTQLRMLPVNDDYIEACLDLADSLAATTGCRIDVDDRDMKIGRKIRDAEKEWTPLIVVYGDKEAASDQLPVRFRDTEALNVEHQVTALDANTLEEKLKGLQGTYPQELLPLPVRLSLRPKWRG